MLTVSRSGSSGATRPSGASSGALTGLIARAVAVKARLVEQDERDLGPRRALNYGHTVGHALERAVVDLLHGEAAKKP